MSATNVITAEYTIENGQASFCRSSATDDVTQVKKTADHYFSRLLPRFFEPDLSTKLEGRTIIVTLSPNTTATEFEIFVRCLGDNAPEAKLLGRELNESWAFAVGGIPLSAAPAKTAAPPPPKAPALAPASITPSIAISKTLTDQSAVKPPVVHSKLGENSQFVFEGQSYHIAHTKGDGACAAHALLGTKTSGNKDYAYRDGDVRQAYVKGLSEKLTLRTIQQKWNQWMISFLKDYLVNPTYYSRLVFDRVKTDGLKREIDQLQQKKQILLETQVAYFNQALADKNCREIIGSVVELNTVNYIDKIREDLDTIIALLADTKLEDTQTEIGALLQFNYLEIAENDRQQEECYERFVSTTEVFRSYINGISSPTYYFSIQEIGLMAQLFDRHVTVFEQRNGIVNKVLVEGNPACPSVEVFHGGLHFSRCERTQKR
jgi:hypothetical protein